MKIGIISDTHDNIKNTKVALDYFDKNKITHGLHLGDFCAPFIVTEMLEHENISWTCVWGNVDGAKPEIIIRTNDNERFDITPRSFRDFKTEEGNIFVTHYPQLAEHAAETGKYIAAFYGHTHQKYSKILDNGVVLANPGEVIGFATDQPSFGIFDTMTKQFEIVDIERN